MRSRNQVPSVPCSLLEDTSLVGGRGGGGESSGEWRTVRTELQFRPRIQLLHSSHQESKLFLFSFLSPCSRKQTTKHSKGILGKTSQTSSRATLGTPGSQFRRRARLLLLCVSGAGFSRSQVRGQGPGSSPRHPRRDRGGWARPGSSRTGTRVRRAPLPRPAKKVGGREPVLVRTGPRSAERPSPSRQGRWVGEARRRRSAAAGPRTGNGPGWGWRPTRRVASVNAATAQPADAPTTVPGLIHPGGVRAAGRLTA